MRYSSANGPIGIRLRGLAERMNRRRPGRPDKDLEGGGVPADPDRPRGLSGGAAAALDFDDA